MVRSGPENCERNPTKKALVCVEENEKRIIKQMSNPMKPTSSVASTSAPKPLPKTKKKPAKGKRSSYRKQYKRLKPKLRRLIEEGIVLKEKLRRKQEKLTDMSRDIHYILGRLMPYKKKLTQSTSKSATSSWESPALNHHPTITCSTSSPVLSIPDQSSLRSTTSMDVIPAAPSSWDGISSSFSSSNMLVDSCKSRIFCLPPEVESQLASIMSDRPSLTLPDDIFSES